MTRGLEQFVAGKKVVLATEARNFNEREGNLDTCSENSQVIQLVSSAEVSNFRQYTIGKKDY